jgi:hypothetical protein
LPTNGRNVACCESAKAPRSWSAALFFLVSPFWEKKRLFLNFFRVVFRVGRSINERARKGETEKSGGLTDEKRRGKGGERAKRRGGFSSGGFGV